MKKPQKKKLVISKNIPSLLQEVPFHSKRDNIERIIPENFPIYLAIHTIRYSSAKSSQNRYVKLHKHDSPEVNILISDKDSLKYEIQTNDKLYKVESPASIYIPAEVEHAANHISGTGFYICIILPDSGSAFNIPEIKK